MEGAWAAALGRAPALALPQFPPAAPSQGSVVPWDSGTVGLGVAWGTAAADALPFKGKLGSCLVGGFLACMWRWVIWLQPAFNCREHAEKEEEG